MPTLLHLNGAPGIGKLPQMLLRETELTRFSEVAAASGAGYRHVMLGAPDSWSSR